MLARDIMVNQVYKVKESDTVRSVIEKFIDYKISGLPIVNDRNEIVGFISDGDVLRYIGKHDDHIIDSIYYAVVIKGDDEDFDQRLQSLLHLNVMKIAKKKVVKVAWDEKIEVIAALLGKKQIKKVPVEKNGILAGIISRGDVIRNSFKELI
ncbi:MULTISPECIES: CBS domain-containing protein [Bacillaceae]|uniref:CBS domain-containing protein n=1 Tax=Niallia hominis TaxID=3133173 RepID=A0ABV1EZ39_9BACI|nr:MULTISPECIES: CBS domain-containing protein [Bacillaceae]MCF2649258.1 CBS domain-containing protein [Niallia circulans]MCM3363422.1 CBS domain-containing protein [Niallia sp. MER TA 168]REB74154.1 CBS domain-containing protein [Cutibacterium acnes]